MEPWSHTTKALRLAIGSGLLIGAAALLIDGVLGRVEEHRRNRPGASVGMEVPKHADAQIKVAHGYEHDLQTQSDETLIGIHAKGRQ